MQRRRLPGWIAGGNVSTRGLWMWTIVERTQKEGCQAGCQREHCCSQLLPAGLQAFGERPSQRLVQKFAQVQQTKNRGELEPRGLTHCLALLSCYTVVILLGCKDRVGAEEVGFQFVWRSLVRFSQGWCWGNKWLRHTLYRNCFDFQKKNPQHLKSIFLIVSACLK